MENAIVVSKENLAALISDVAREVVAGISVTPKLPTYYKFPEDIHTILKGAVSLSTIRSWRTKGYLEVFKVGQKAFVTPEKWEWFVQNNGPMMAKDTGSFGKK